LITDLWLYELGDVLLVSLDRAAKDSVLAKFDQFIFSEDVQIGDVTDAYSAVAVLGPEAASLLALTLALDSAALDALPEHGNLRATFSEQPVIVLCTSDLGVRGFDVLVPVALAADFRETLQRHGARWLDESTAETLRIEAGIPKFHQDMDETTIPLEAGIESRAISMTKGCYVGQEVIVRILHRGHGRVAKKLVGLLVSGDASIARGLSIDVAGASVGAVTSVAWSPRLQSRIALGYVHRDFLAPGPAVVVAGYDATVVALPFGDAAISH
jgi:folate-binding protein YgfZ